MSERLDISVALGFEGFKLDARLDLPLAGFTAITGPSGGGKTTLLRIIAGFERRARGHVRCGEGIWQDSAARVYVPAHRRPVGTVFQDARLFGHLDVLGNLRYAARRAPRTISGAGLDDVITALDLTPLLRRRTHALSGGEKQRVALGRMLLTRPRLLLFDEPLSGTGPGAEG